MAIWKQAEYGTGRCVNCGFLGKRSPKLDEKCFHASGKDRTLGRLNEHDTFEGGLSNLSTIPWCFVGKADFIEELADIGAMVHQPDKVQEIIEKDRKCPSWYPWREFATPAEHFQESMMLAMDQRREEFELRLEELNRQERRRTNKVMICLAIAAVIFAAAQVYAALAVINPEHWLFRWLH